MAKFYKKQKPVNKDCLRFVKAVLSENNAEATEILKKLVKRNIAKKRLAAEKETELF